VALVILIGLVLVFWTLTTQTRYGQHVYAVGGNAEAAHRAGIGVTAVRVSVFTLSGATAALGGIMSALGLGMRRKSFSRSTAAADRRRRKAPVGSWRRRSLRTRPLTRNRGGAPSHAPRHPPSLTQRQRRRVVDGVSPKCWR
jgi:hypothetical protein